MNNKNSNNTKFIPLNLDIISLQKVEKILTLSDIFNRLDPENEPVFKYKESGGSNQVFFYSIDNKKIAIRISSNPISTIKKVIEVRINDKNIYFYEDKTIIDVYKDKNNKYELSFNELYNIWEIWDIENYNQYNNKDNSVLLYYSDKVDIGDDDTLNISRIWNKYNESKNDEVIDLKLKKIIYQDIDVKSELKSIKKIKKPIPSKILDLYKKKYKRLSENKLKSKIFENKAQELKEKELLQNKQNWVIANNKGIIPELYYYGSIIIDKDDEIFKKFNIDNIYSCIISEAYDNTLYYFLSWCNDNFENYVNHNSIYLFEDMIVKQYTNLVKKCIFDKEINLISFDNSLNNLVLKFNISQDDSLVELLKIPNEIKNSHDISKLFEIDYLFDIKFIDLDSDNFISIDKLKTYGWNDEWKPLLYFLNIIIMANHLVYYFNRNIFYNFFLENKKELLKKKKI